MPNTSVSQNQTVALPSAGVRVACATVFFVGASLVFLVGFAHSATLHNTAHDTRHSLAFPCH